jgi:murein DD-endopeptidase MepM/ murein hydrolase activator NlpD
MRQSISILWLLAGAAAPGARGQDAPATDVRWFPAMPVQGSFVQFVIATGGNGDTLAPAATLAGQPLHFERDAAGRFRALGGIPIGSRATIPLLLALPDKRGGTRDTVLRIPVAAGEFAMERLAVAPQFVERPDSALAARIEEERARAGLVSQRTHRRPRLWTGEFTLPVDGRVTSSFGRGREFNGKLQSRHMGTDLSGQTGTPVHAPNRGVVALVGAFYYAGNVVYLDHGAGLVTVYMHLSEVLVSEGDTVEAGQLLGKVGATGRVTGPHLHWTARYGSISLDPLSLFDTQLGSFAVTAP